MADGWDFSRMLSLQRITKELGIKVEAYNGDICLIATKESTTIHSGTTHGYFKTIKEALSYCYGIQTATGER